MYSSRRRRERNSAQSAPFFTARSSSRGRTSRIRLSLRFLSNWSKSSWIAIVFPRFLFCVPCGIPVFSGGRHKRQLEELPGQVAKDHPFDAGGVEESVAKRRCGRLPQGIGGIVQIHPVQMPDRSGRRPAALLPQRLGQRLQFPALTQEDLLLGQGRKGLPLFVRTSLVAMFRQDRPAPGAVLQPIVAGGQCVPGHDRDLVLGLFYLDPSSDEVLGNGVPVVVEVYHPLQIHDPYVEGVDFGDVEGQGKKMRPLRPEQGDRSGSPQMAATLRVYLLAPLDHLAV